MNNVIVTHAPIDVTAITTDITFARCMAVGNHIKGMSDTSNRSAEGCIFSLLSGVEMLFRTKHGLVAQW